MEELDYYLRLLVAKDAGLIFLCIFGAILNGVMLYMLMSKKQVRSSVHTVYMVQIALTDLLVCIVWLILTCLMTNNLLRQMGGPSDYVSNDTEGGDDNGSDVLPPDYVAVMGEETSSTQYRMWRIMYSWYNFHYYTNIFLLASMSVERCAAVWKSMRCQRYQYNRKAIYTVSVFMWVLALAFVIPNFVDPDMIVRDSDSAPGLSRTIGPTSMPSLDPDVWNGESDALSKVFQGRSLKDNELVGVLESGKLDDGGDFIVPEESTGAGWSHEEEEKLYQTDLEVLYECYTLLLHARNLNREHVTDNGRISLEGCVTDIMAIMNEYSPEFGKSINPDGEEPGVEPAYSIDYSSEGDDNSLGSYIDDDDYYGGEILPDNEKPPDTGMPPSGGHVGVNKSTFRLERLECGFYQILLTDAVQALINHHEKTALNEACDPHLSTVAQIYVLTVNLVLGFFIPFLVITFSYVSIAYMIGKRARSRMNPHMSEGSTTNFTHNYLQNPSTTNIPLAHVTARNNGRGSRHTDSMGRRMSDFMKYVLLRKPQDGADNGTYWTESDRECTPYNSMQKMPLTSSSKRSHDQSEAAQHTRNHITQGGVLHRIRKKFNRGSNVKQESSEAQDEDEGLTNAVKCDEVKLRNREEDDLNMRITPLRAKKYSFSYDVTNENIPQTIAEHPLEAEDMENEEFLTASNGSFPTDLTPPGARAHAALLLMQRNSRRESGGSYGSSVDSMATDQTSLITSLGHDKRHSAATTMSALTPPTPNDPGNPNANVFFPPHDEKIAYNRSQSADACYNSTGEYKEGPHPADQRFFRAQKPGSQLNDITLKLYRKSMQKRQHEDLALDTQQKQTENATDGPGTSAENIKEKAISPTAAKTTTKDRYSYPRMNRSLSVPEERSHPVRNAARTSKSSSRISGDLQRLSNGESDQHHLSHYPKYHRQNSSSSTVFYTRARTYSTTSRGSVTGTSTLRKTMARKNAERHLRVSRTVLAYVVVFAICWLPQRIVYLLYVIKALMGTPAPICIKVISGTRVVSFISVLLNPIVYIVTQRELRAYVRNSWCVTKLRHWYAKCVKKPAERPYDRESDIRGPTSSNRQADEVEMQGRQEMVEKDESSSAKATGNRSPFRMTSPQRPTLHIRKNSSGTHDVFTAAAALTARRRDATIDEMKEEEAAAEESLEKEMERLAAEEKKREEDKRNENWFNVPTNNVISGRDTSGSGNKTSSSGGKSEQSSGKGENFEEFWVRWLQSGGADLLSPANGDLSTSDPSDELEARMVQLGNIVRHKIAGDPNNEVGETII